jgi:hypothetical protein
MFDSEKAVWMNAVGHCTEAGGPNCSGIVGKDPNNKVQLVCERPGGCAADLSAIVVADTVEQVDQ